MLQILLLFVVFFHEHALCTDTWFRFLYVTLCHLVDFIWNHHPGIALLCNCCCCCRWHRVADGGGAGRPTGAKNRTGKPQRQSKRRRTRKFRYADQAGPSAKRAAKQAQAMRRKRYKSLLKSGGPKPKRTRTASSRNRSKQGKDRRRAKALEAKRQQRAEFAGQLRNQLAALVLPSLTIGQIKQLALTAFYSALAKGWPTRQSAAEFVSAIFQVHPKTLLTWASELEFALLTDGPSDCTGAGEIAEQLMGCETLWLSLRGKHAKTVWLLADHEKQRKARAWVLEHADQPGKPTMKVRHFRHYLNRKLLRLGSEQVVSESTARAYLHRLGFVVSDTKQGIVIELHERGDVVQARSEYVKRIQAELQSGAVLVFQDESCFNSNDCARWVWAQEGSVCAKTKGKDRGKSIMVSLFATAEGGVVDECTLELDIGRDGYFNTKRFLSQVRSVRRISSCAAVRVVRRWML
jgi:hypothetical protein